MVRRLFKQLKTRISAKFSSPASRQHEENPSVLPVAESGQLQPLPGYPPFNYEEIRLAVLKDYLENAEDVQKKLPSVRKGYTRKTADYKRELSLYSPGSNSYIQTEAKIAVIEEKLYEMESEVENIPRLRAKIRDLENKEITHLIAARQHLDNAESFTDRLTELKREEKAHLQSLLLMFGNPEFSPTQIRLYSAQLKTLRKAVKSAQRLSQAESIGAARLQTGEVLLNAWQAGDFQAGRILWKRFTNANFSLTPLQETIAEAYFCDRHTTQKIAEENTLTPRQVAGHIGYISRQIKTAVGIGQRAVKIEDRETERTAQDYFLTRHFNTLSKAGLLEISTSKKANQKGRRLAARLIFTRYAADLVTAESSVLTAAQKHVLSGLFQKNRSMAELAQGLKTSEHGILCIFSTALRRTNAYLSQNTPGEQISLELPTIPHPQEPVFAQRILVVERSLRVYNASAFSVEPA